MTNTIGTDNVYVNKLSDGTYQFSIVDYPLDNINLFTTSDQLIVGGNALTMYKAKQGNYVIPVILDYTLPVTENQTAINGNYFKIINGSLSASHTTTPSDNYLKKTQLFNLPVMLDNNNSIVTSEVDGIVNQYATTCIGGNPIKIGRIGNNWYLILSISPSSIHYFALGTGTGAFLSFGFSAIMSPF